MESRRFCFVSPLPCLVFAISLIAIRSSSAQAPPDLVVDADVTVPGGRYGSILVKNGGSLTMSGDVYAVDIFVQWGTINVIGRLAVESDVELVADPEGAIFVESDSSSAGNVHVHGGRLEIQGVWSVGKMRIAPGATVQVNQYAEEVPMSGMLYLTCRRLDLEQGSHFSADGAGADPRGEGGGYGSSGGGGYGGDGGRGYWSATHPGSAFGDAYSYTIEMGSYGGVPGGGLLSIVADTMIAAGEITSNGADGSGSRGGGSGGGILFRVSNATIQGNISADGGDAAAGSSGGGGGGRIKFFYEGGVSTTILLPRMSVKGGLRGGGRNTRDGGDGTIWTDAIPGPPELLGPDDGDTVEAEDVVLRFVVFDQSEDLDERADQLSGLIELSTDSFKTVFRTFDQTTSLSGWSEYFYAAQDVAVLKPTETLPGNHYQWRAAARDKSVTGRSSSMRSFLVNGTPVAPDLVYPASGDSEILRDTLFRWTLVYGATSYRLQLARDSIFTNLILDVGGIANTNYSTDDVANGGLYYWRVAAKNDHGSSPWSDIAAFTMASDVGTEDSGATPGPGKYALYQNYPNPFSRNSTVRYDLLEAGDVQLNVYNVLGRCVQRYFREGVPAGSHWFTLQAGELPSGVYAYEVRADGYRQSRIMTVVR